MAGVTTSSSVEENDYLDHLSRILPWHRSFTSYERIIIVVVVGVFVSFVGFTLFCLICSQSVLRRRYTAKKKLGKY
jgi:hypothetical protein